MKELERLMTYRQIWKHLPWKQREEILAAMLCWAPLEFRNMVREFMDDPSLVPPELADQINQKTKELEG